MSQIAELDGVVQCLDTGCLGWAHDVIDEKRGIWLVECCFCGTKQRMRAIRSHVETKTDEVFVMRGGRFDGMTLPEIAKNHLDYIQYAAEEHERKAVREACKKFLDTLKTTS